MTNKLDKLQKKNILDSIVFIYPFIETRTLVTRSYYYADEETFLAADSLVKNSMAEFLNKKRPIEYERLANPNKFKVLLDSIKLDLKVKKYSQYFIPKNNYFTHSTKFVLITHHVWTRTVPDFESEKCGHDLGKIYSEDDVCSWTHSHTFLMLIDTKNYEIAYFKVYDWERSNRHFPIKRIIDRSFRKCGRPLLRKLI